MDQEILEIMNVIKRKREIERTEMSRKRIVKMRKNNKHNPTKAAAQEERIEMSRKQMAKMREKNKHEPIKAAALYWV